MLQGLRGGVGTTSLLAAMAQALVQQGERVLCLDLDPRNLLRLHFGHGLGEESGWAQAWAQDSDWTCSAFQSESNLHFLPYGNVSSNLVLTLERELSSAPDWWRKKLARLSPSAYDWLLVDTPQGMPGHQRQIRQIASCILHICQADAACHILLQSLSLSTRESLLISRFSASSQLQRDLRLLWQQYHRGRLAPDIIHQDENVMESLAQRQNVCRYQPESQAAQDIQRLVAWCLTSVAETPWRAPREATP